VVVPNAEKYRVPVKRLLEKEKIKVIGVEKIVPTLEDVFISTINGIPESQ